MFFIVDTSSTFFESLGWSDLIRLYPSIVILLSSLGIEEFRKVSVKEFRKVSVRHIMS